MIRNALPRRTILGATLVEAIVGSIVIGIVGVAIAGSQVMYWRIQGKAADELAARNLDIAVSQIGADNGFCQRALNGVSLGSAGSVALPSLNLGGSTIGVGSPFFGFNITSISLEYHPSVINVNTTVDAVTPVAPFNGRTLATLAITGTRQTNGQVLNYSRRISVPIRVTSGTVDACLIPDQGGGSTTGSGSPSVMMETACQDIGGVWVQENQLATPIPSSCYGIPVIYFRTGCDVILGLCRALGAEPELWTYEELRSPSEDCAEVLNPSHPRRYASGYARRCNTRQVHESILATSIGAGPCPTGTFLKAFRADGTKVCGDASASTATSATRSPSCSGTCSKFNFVARGCPGGSSSDIFINGVYSGHECSPTSPPCTDDVCP